jgi:3-methyladenine DNA glycosylase AlkD
MGKYMRDQFMFLGVASPVRKKLVTAALRSVTGRPDEHDLESFARLAFAREAREFHYAGVGVVRRKIEVLSPDSIPLVRCLVVTHSWWDTVDEIASHLAGGIVAAYPETASVMDDWAQSEHMWVARTAILHQLRYKAQTDADRLFRYCLDRADEQDFFYRKAIGWALREYSKTDADAVRKFCAQHQDRLSPLSLREARKHL